MHRIPSLLLACVLALGVAVPGAADEAPPTAPPPTPSTPPSAPRAEPAAPQPAAGPTEAEREEIRRLVAELREEASRLRGLPWKREVPADLLTRDQMVEYMLREIAEEYTPEEKARDERILRRQGLLGPDEDVVDLQVYMLRQAAAGFFDPKSERLYLIAGVSGEAQKPAILHELVHALEHQHYDLEKRAKRWEDEPNRFFAEKCLGEGSAEHARGLYERENPEAGRRMREEQGSWDGLQRQMKMLERVPAFLIVNTMLHYDLGPKLVGRFVKSDYPGGMNRLYEDPPTTQEQWLHPEKYLGEKRDLERRVVWGGDVVAAAGPGWKKHHELSTGQLDLGLFLDFHLGTTKGRVNLMAMGLGLWATPAALKAAMGWDAGRDLYLAKEGLPLGWISALAFDTPKDAEEAADAIALAVRKLAGGSFQGGTWSGPAGSPRRLDWTTGNGPGRLLVRGDEVLVVDGLPAERFEAVWSVVEQTRFERDPADAVPVPSGA